MTEHETDVMDEYGLRLGRELHALSGRALRPLDAAAVARTVIRDGARRGSAGPFAIRRWLVPVMLAILLTIAGRGRAGRREPPARPCIPIAPRAQATPTGSHGPRPQSSRRHAPRRRASARDGWPQRRARARGDHQGSLARTNLTAELYDPASGSFLATGDPVEARLGHTSTLLDDGRVLIVGGVLAHPTRTAEAELYDPRTGRFTPTGALAAPRSEHAAVTLADGTGGDHRRASRTSENVSPGVEVYDPATGTFRPGPTDPLLARVASERGPAARWAGPRRRRDGALARPMDRAVLEHAAIWDPSTDTVLDIGALPGPPARPGRLSRGTREPA